MKFTNKSYKQPHLIDKLFDLLDHYNNRVWYVVEIQPNYGIMLLKSIKIKLKLYLYNLYLDWMLSGQWVYVYLIHACRGWYM